MDLPPPDTKLPELESEIDRIVKDKLREHGLFIASPLTSHIDVPKDNMMLFKVRYNIEIQLRRIWVQHYDIDQLDEKNRHLSIIRIIQDLINHDIIENNLYGILRDILSICNYAIHGESVTEKQVSFITNNANQVIDYLSQVN